jgi:apolipoprotein D and lipocalin family protein
MKFFKLFLLSYLIITSAHAQKAQVIAVDHFSVERYLGTWYEVARIPFYFERDCRAPTTAHYALDPHDTNKISVINTCYVDNNKYKSATGVAYFSGAANVGKLTVTFLPTYLRWVPFTHGNYWVLYTDYEHYSLVGDPSHKYLWLLSRSEKLEPQRINALLKIAQEQGFDITKLVFNYPFTPIE